MLSQYMFVLSHVYVCPLSFPLNRWTCKTPLSFLKLFSANYKLLQMYLHNIIICTTPPVSSNKAEKAIGQAIAREQIYIMLSFCYCVRSDEIYKTCDV